MKTVRVALLISGGGTTAEAVISACQRGFLKGIDPVVVISSRADAPGIMRAKKLRIPTLVAGADALLRILQLFRVNVVSQNGWLPLTPPSVIRQYKGNIINQHPGPLDTGRPDFGGKGMYGKRVICARIAYAWLTGCDFWTEATTHIVTTEFDTGPAIRRVRMSIPLSASRRGIIRATNEVAAKLLPIEHANVIATLQMFAARKKLPELRRRMPLILAKNINILLQAKRLAIELFPKG